MTVQPNTTNSSHKTAYLPSATDTSVSDSVTLAQLLDSGKPFVEFPRYSILSLKQLNSNVPASTNLDGGIGHQAPENFSQWLTTRLQIGQPFVIQDFDRLPEWDKRIFSLEGLIDHSTKKNIPIRNCTTNRDLNFTLKKFADAAAQQSTYKEFKNLYARDLQCPEAWLNQCRSILPPEVQWGGRLDLFQWLPSCARSEVMMAYVGSEGSSSGFHRCFSSTVACNLLVACSDRPVLCFGTDFASQAKYDTFMAARGASPHVDWLNLEPEELAKADFPVYVCEQWPGDLVIFPPATAHQVWNMSSVSTKCVWNILHPLSLEAGFHYVQPPFNRLCHPDVARSNLSLACAMLSLLRDDQVTTPPDLRLLTKLFRQMVQDEKIDDTPATQISVVRIPNTAIATCNFCGTAIWNRHLRCGQCQDFDLCLMCYLSGRSCEHVSSYSWAEIVPQETCALVLSRAEKLIGYSNDKPVKEPRNQERRKPLGTAVNELMLSRQSMAMKLCHLCRIDHHEWKGKRCDKCSAFFCYRGLFRHFDVHSADVMRHAGLWICPKCSETCNCRCCHFTTAYVKAQKPASKRRVKPGDPRGKTMGFNDNVFDQKKRNTPAPPSGAFTSPPMKQPTKRSFPSLSPPPPLTLLPVPPQPHIISTVGFPTPEPDSLTLNMHARPDSSSEPVNADDSSHHRSKVQRTSVFSRKPPPKHIRDDTSDGKTLQGIEYITQMLSPSNDRLSLPPLQNTHGSGGSLDPVGASSLLLTNGVGMTNLANLASSRDREPMPYGNTHANNMNIPRNDRDIKSDSGSEGVHPMTPVIPHSHSLSHISHPTPQLQQQQQPPMASYTPGPKQHHQHAGNNTYLTSTAPAPSTASRSTYPTVTHSANNNASLTTATITANAPISTLDAQLLRLRQHSDELLALSFYDSHKLLQDEIHRLETILLSAKKDRSERILRNLEAEFPDLVNIHEGLRREGARLGYF
ncbi:hypothetical protein FQN57_005712 [Myotisia sp. PD_48]|nr:hypothetical protein FQN57_005712 [Myotisia sp. PD_48]